MPRLTYAKYFFCCILSCVVVVAFAQASEDCTEWDDLYLNNLAQAWPDNTIENAGRPLQWNPKGGERLTVLQIGDSHIQGDISVCATRSYLVQQFDLTPPARGFVFPYGIVRTNEPLDVRSTGSNRKGWSSTLSTKIRTPQALGLASSVIEAKNAKSTLNLRFHPERGNTALPNQVSILYAPSENVPMPLLNGTEPATIDTTRGVATFQFAEPPSKLDLTLRRNASNESPFRLFGFVFDNEASPLMYHAAGLNGADVNSFLRNTALPLELEILDPKVIIVSLGTNDAYNLNFDPLQFASNLRTLVQQIRSSCPKAFIILTTPNDHLLRNKELNPRVDAASEVIRNVAMEQEVGLWDFNRIMGGSGSIYSWNNYGLTAKDCLHLSPQGYRLQGKLLGVALYRYLTNNKRGKK